MKLSELISKAEDVDIRPNMPLLANIDPQDIPLSIAQNLTPTLEDPEGKEKKIAEFPEVYVPDNLDLGDIKGLKRTCESMTYMSTTAANNLDLIRDSADLAKTGEISDIAGRVIRTQIASALAVVPESNVKIEENLDKILTSDGPYRQAVTMEALNMTASSLSSAILKGLQISKGIADYIQKNGNIQNLDNQLSTGFEIMKTLDQAKDSAEMQTRLSEIYPGIVNAVKAGFEPQQVTDNLSVPNGSVSSTACVCIARGLGRIKLSTERNFTGTDIKQVAAYLQFCIQSLQFYSQALTKIVELIETPVPMEEIGEKKPEKTEQSIEMAGSTNSQIFSILTEFFESVRGLSTQNQLFDSTNPSQTGDRAFPIIPGWSGIIVRGNGDSENPQEAGRSQIAVIDYKSVSDIMTLTKRDLLPKLQEIFSLVKTTDESVSKILEKLKAGMPGDDHSGIYQASTMKLVYAVKLSSKIVFSSTEAVVSISQACIDISRGIGIIAEGS